MSKARQTKSNSTTGHIMHSNKPVPTLSTYQREMLQKIEMEVGRAMAVYVRTCLENELQHSSIMHRLERTYKIMQGY